MFPIDFSTSFIFPQNIQIFTWTCGQVPDVSHIYKNHHLLGPTTEIVEAQCEIMYDACDTNNQRIRYVGGNGGGNTETVIMPMGIQIWSMGSNVKSTETDETWFLSQFYDFDARM